MTPASTERILGATLLWIEAGEAIEPYRCVKISSSFIADLYSGHIPTQADLDAGWQFGFSEAFIKKGQCGFVNLDKGRIKIGAY